MQLIAGGKGVPYRVVSISLKAAEGLKACIDHHTQILDHENCQTTRFYTLGMVSELLGNRSFRIGRASSKKSQRLGGQHCGALGVYEALGQDGGSLALVAFLMVSRNHVIVWCLERRSQVL